jgi:hypothetical protein
VLYKGEQFVAVTGVQTGQIPSERVRELYQAFVGTGFFSLNDSYAAITDIGGERTSISYDNRFKSVVNKGVAPFSLTEPDLLIDQIAGTEKWVKRFTKKWLMDANDFINAYEGGGCLFVTPVAISGDTATLLAYGMIGDFYAFDDKFKRQMGSEALITVRLVTSKQCAAVNFLWRLRNQRQPAPDLNISESRSTLDGEITNFSARHIELLLVHDNGDVQKLTALVHPIGQNTATFRFATKHEGKGELQAELLIIIVSNLPVEALKADDLGQADHLFPQIHAEALKTGQSLNVKAWYFESD